MELPSFAAALRGSPSIKLGMERPLFAAALKDSPSITSNDLVFPDSYHSCFTKRDNSFPFIKSASRRNGKPAFILSADEQAILADPLKHTLICKFSARMPNFELIRKHFDSLRLKGTWRIGLLDNRHVMIKLDLDQDYAFVFAKKLHRIDNVLVKFLKWNVDFDFRSEPPIAPVWIRFPGLKLHLFHKQILFSLATVFSKPLKLDLPTYNLSRPSAARVLVEMDITYSYENEIWIGSQDEGYWQEVIIDSKPLYCAHCRIFGHCIEECFIANPLLRQVRPDRNKNFMLKDMQISELVDKNNDTAENGCNTQRTDENNSLMKTFPSNEQSHVIRQQPSFALDLDDCRQIGAISGGCYEKINQQVTGRTSSNEEFIHSTISNQTTTSDLLNTNPSLLQTNSFKSAPPNYTNAAHNEDSALADNDPKLLPVFKGELHLSTPVHVQDSHSEQQEIDPLELSRDIEKQIQQGVSVHPVTVFEVPVTDSCHRGVYPSSSMVLKSALPVSREVTNAINPEALPSSCSTPITQQVSAEMEQVSAAVLVSETVTGSAAPVTWPNPNSYSNSLSCHQEVYPSSSLLQDHHSIAGSAIPMEAVAPIMDLGSVHPNLVCPENLKNISSEVHSANVEGVQAYNFNFPALPPASVNTTSIPIDHQPNMSIVKGSAVPSTVLKIPPVPKFKDSSSKLFNQQMKATVVSTPSAASPSTLLKHPPVYNMQPNFHSNLNSEEGNTDSDSYETYTGSNIEEDLQLNDACKEVLEEWQAEWEYQKSKKKQKGIRELRGLSINVGNSRKYLGSRRSLSGHL